MSDAAVDDIVALLPPLLTSIDALAFVARYLNPPDYEAVLEAAGTPDDALREARVAAWRMAGAARTCAQARWKRRATRRLPHSTACAACAEQPDGLRAAYRALRHAPRAQEALYPLAANLPPVSQFFLDPAVRNDAALQARLDGVRPAPTPASCMSTTSRAAAAASRCTCRNTTRPIAPGRW